MRPSATRWVHSAKRKFAVGNIILKKRTLTCLKYCISLYLSPSTCQMTHCEEGLPKNNTVKYWDVYRSVGVSLNGAWKYGGGCHRQKKNDFYPQTEPGRGTGWMENDMCICWEVRWVCSSMQPWGGSALLARLESPSYCSVTHL